MTEEVVERSSGAVVEEDGSRVPGRPPLVMWAPLVWFAVLSTVLTVVVLVVVRPAGPLDDRDLGNQRDGLLLAGPVLPAEVAGVTFGRRPVVLLFDRRLRDPAVLTRWRSQVPLDADVRIVLPAPAWRDPGLAVVVDPAGALADAVRLPTPVDGGQGIGYAVVDRDRQVRYSTLDPAYPDNAFEVATVIKDLP